MITTSKIIYLVIGIICSIVLFNLAMYILHEASKIRVTPLDIALFFIRKFKEGNFTLLSKALSVECREISVYINLSGIIKVVRLNIGLIIFGEYPLRTNETLMLYNRQKCTLLWGNGSHVGVLLPICVIESNDSIVIRSFQVLRVQGRKVIVSLKKEIISPIFVEELTVSCNEYKVRIRVSRPIILRIQIYEVRVPCYEN